jgi:acetyltransferase-like isoleucine patch superfamily enzyme
MHLSLFERLAFLAQTTLRFAGGIILRCIPYFRFIGQTKDTQTPITFSNWVRQKVFGKNRFAYWPTSSSSIVVNPQNIYAGIETSPGLMPGCYIQAIGELYIGDYTQIAANVGIITANHDTQDNRQHVVEKVKIGKYCWLGMGSIILPGVELGDFTVVGAGSIVTRSFPEGYCVVGGNPARLIRKLDPKECIRHRSLHEYNGYIRSDRFEDFRKKHLKVGPW